MKWINDIFPACNYMFKVNNKNTRARYEICSKLTIKTPERRHGRSGVFIVNFEHISHLVSIVNFEQVNAVCVVVSFNAFLSPGNFNSQYHQPNMFIQLCSISG